MIHPLVAQLRFTRSEFRRGLVGLTEEEAAQRFMPMNCISWNVGHLAWQEQRYFVYFAQGKVPQPALHELFAYGAPASIPSLQGMWSAWTAITRAADVWLATVTSDTLQQHVVIDGQATSYVFGSLLQRLIYHYWYHTGENLAIRQLLGHADLPEFVGDLDGEAPYRPEPK
jgi:uncharacterized damage-inducible protein DinB